MEGYLDSDIRVSVYFSREAYSESICFWSTFQFIFKSLGWLLFPFKFSVYCDSKKATMSALQAIKYTRGKLEVLDQLRLPHESVYDDVSTCEQAFDCIKSMRVRGI